MSATERWAAELAAWAIPPEILDAAPEPPWGFPPELFTAPDPESRAHSRSAQRALEALPEGGTVLDVGVGGGAASLVLAPPAGRVVGVDEGEALLAKFAATADERGIEHEAILGRWPDIAPHVPLADVVVSHHVLYNVPDAIPFVLALTDHARRRVVMELTATHPLTVQRDLWKRFHDLDRPEGPTADDIAAVLEEAGIEFDSERSTPPPRPRPEPHVQAAFVRRRLCLPVEREPEVAEVLANREVLPRQVATFWWDGRASD